MKNRKVTFIAALVILVMVMLPGLVFAGGKGETESKEGGEAAAVEKTVETPPITILINDSPWFAGFETIVDMYQKETGNKVNLNVTPFPGMLQKSRSAVQGSVSEFDIINMNEMWYIQFYANGWVTPIKEIDPDFSLDPNIIEYDYATRWDPEIKFSSKDGEIYGLPINGNIQLFFYRKDLLEKVGMDVPKTWDDIDRFAKAVHDPPNMYGYAGRTQPSRWHFAAWNTANGGDYIRLDENTKEWEVTIHHDEVVEALDQWMSLQFAYAPANYTDLGQNELLALMSSGKLAQTDLVCASAPHFSNPDQSVVVGKVGASVIPGPKSGSHASMTGIWVMGVPHNLPMERKEAALDFLNWALTKKAQLAYTRAGAIPVRQDVYEELSTDPEMGWWMNAMAESNPYISAYLRIEETPQLNEVIDRRISQVVLKELSAEDALWEAAKEIHKIMEEAGYAVKPLTR